jgi:hypothetical protein
MSSPVWDVGQGPLRHNINLLIKKIFASLLPNSITKNPALLAGFFADYRFGLDLIRFVPTGLTPIPVTITLILHQPHSIFDIVIRLMNIET